MGRFMSDGKLVDSPDFSQFIGGQYRYCEERASELSEKLPILGGLEVVKSGLSKAASALKRNPVKWPKGMEEYVEKHHRYDAEFVPVTKWNKSEGPLTPNVHYFEFNHSNFHMMEVSCMGICPRQILTDVQQRYSKVCFIFYFREQGFFWLQRDFG